MWMLLYVNTYNTYKSNFKRFLNSRDDFIDDIVQNGMAG